MPKSLLPRPRFWVEAAQQKQTRRSLIGEFLMFVIVYLVAYMIQGFLVGVPTVFWLMTSQELFPVELSSMEEVQAAVLEILQHMPDWLIVAAMFAYAIFGLAAVFYCVKVEKRRLSTMGLQRQGALREYGFGLVFGLFLMVGIVLIGVAAGGYRLNGLQHAWLPLLPVLLGCMVQAASEELLYRGYLTVSLSTRFPVGFAILLSILAKQLVSSNTGALSPMVLLNTVLLAGLLSVYVIKRGSLWGACGIHAVWNFALGGLFGFGGSGILNHQYLIDVQVQPYQALLTGGEFGPEGSICTTVALLAGLGIVLALHPKDPAPEPERP